MKNKSAGGLPFVSSVGDSIDLMKRMWGMAGLPVIPGAGDLASMAVRLPTQIPSMLAPTIDLDELDKRITDLRAVGQWLELNAGLLRTTIQTLEVQRATIATLKGFSGAMFAPMTGKSAAAGPASEQAPVTIPPWPMPVVPAATPSPALPASEAEAPPPARAPRRRRKPAAPTRATIEPPLNPAAWWNTLQDQFSKIAAAAVAPSPADPKPRPKPRPRPKAAASKTTARKRAAKRRGK